MTPASWLMAPGTKVILLFCGPFLRCRALAGPLVGGVLPRTRSIGLCSAWDRSPRGTLCAPAAFPAGHPPALPVHLGLREGDDLAHRVKLQPDQGWGAPAATGRLPQPGRVRARVRSTWSIVVSTPNWRSGARCSSSSFAVEDGTAAAGVPAAGGCRCSRNSDDPRWPRVASGERVAEKVWGPEPPGPLRRPAGHFGRGLRQQTRVQSIGAATAGPDTEEAGLPASSAGALDVGVEQVGSGNTEAAASHG